MKAHAPATRSATPARNGGTFFQQHGAARPAFFSTAAGPLQTALTVSQPGDAHEIEAEKMADRVVSGRDAPFFHPAAGVQRQADISTAVEPGEFGRTAEDERENSGEMAAVQRSARTGTAASLRTSSVCERPGGGRQPRPVSGSAAIFRAAIPIQSGGRAERSGISRARGPPRLGNEFTSQLLNAKAGGQPLPRRVRAGMESAFGTGFSGVHIHADDRAHDLTSGLSALAFTHETDIFFGRGRFQPETPGGLRLLAHELAHVVQQSGSSPRAVESRRASRLRAGSEAAAEPVRDAPAPAGNEAAGGAPDRRSSEGGNAPKRDRRLPSRKREIHAAAETGAASAAGDANRAAAEKPGSEIPRAPATPAADPAFQKVRKEVRAESRRQKAHVPAAKARADAETASALPEADQRSQDAQEKSAAGMGRVAEEQLRAGQKFSADKFKEDLLHRINDKRPESEDEAKAFAQNPPVEHFEAKFAGDVASEQDKVIGPLEQKAAAAPAGGVASKPEAAVPDPTFPAAPRPVEPGPAAPKARTDEEISTKSESDRIDGAMEENRLSDDQLAESQEPSFLETLQVKQEAKRKAAEAPGVYRGKEAEILQSAEISGGKVLSGDLQKMANIRRRSGGVVFGKQQATETKTEKRQREIKETIDGIYGRTVSGVKRILDDMTAKVKTDFTSSLKRRTDIFNENVRRRIGDYYGDWRIDDKLFGPADVVVLPDGRTRPMTLREQFGGGAKTINPDVYEIFVEEKNAFLTAMNGELDAIADEVGRGLSGADERIRLGEKEIADFKATLKGDELGYADQLEEEVKLKFENLRESIDDTREDLLQTLADEYRTNVGQLEKTFNDINDELKKSWIDRAIEFVKTVGKTIFQLADLLLSILVRIAYLVWDIIKHPIRFFETLVSGLKQGLGEFIGNIGVYLKEAFWTWIAGASPVKGIHITESAGEGGMFDLVIQALGLGPSDRRAIVEKVLGREFLQLVDRGMALGEKVLEPVVILLTEGPGALWDYIKESLGGIVRSTFDRIRESVFNAFVEKGLKWVAGFFIPGGGFVKVVKAIVAAFQFVAENLENLRAFFDAVFDSMEAAVQGRTEGVAGKIIAGLKIGVVLALDFLAKQLGLGKIVEGVQKIIQSLRKPIVGAVEWLLRKVKPFVMSVVGKGKELWAAGKRKVLKVGTASMSPQERLGAGLDLAQRAVNRFRGRPVGETVLAPLLRGIATRYGFASLQVVPRGGRWFVRGRVNPGGEKETDAKVGPADPAELRAETQRAMADAARGGLEAAAAPAAVAGVRRRIVGRGAQDVLAEPAADGGFAVSFRANDRYFPVGELSRTLGPAPAGRTVRSETRIHLVAGHPVANLSEILPRDLPAGGLQPTVATGGRTGAAGNQIQILTWNTSPMSRTGGSHAEAHVPAALASDRAAEMLKHIESIAIRNFSFSACTSCGDGLAGMLRRIVAAQRAAGAIVLNSAEIFWTSRFGDTERFVRPDATTWATIQRLAESGWTVHAPVSALPDASRGQPNPVEEAARRRPLSQQVVVIAGTIPRAADLAREREETGATGSRRFFGNRHEAIDFKRRLDRSSGSGRALDAAARKFFEPRFGRDFSAVRVHDDAEAAALARSIRARAFVRGRDIHFAEGRFAPGTPAGCHLLAHELTHVVQQGAAPVLSENPESDIAMKIRPTFRRSARRVSRRAPDAPFFQTDAPEAPFFSPAADVQKMAAGENEQLDKAAAEPPEKKPGEETSSNDR